MANLFGFPFAKGNDLATSPNGWVVSIQEIIDALTGNDAISGRAAAAIAYGIFTDGIINTGDGKDAIEAFDGGFSGFGTTNLGDDDDTLKGFGAGSFNGGLGTDKLLFGDGVYVINAGVVSFDGVAMTVSSFERVGGVGGGLFAVRNGTLTDASGVARFQVYSLNAQGGIDVHH